jgi:hypothetical protein
LIQSAGSPCACSSLSPGTKLKVTVAITSFPEFVSKAKLFRRVHARFLQQQVAVFHASKGDLAALIEFDINHNPASNAFAPRINGIECVYFMHTAYQPVGRLSLLRFHCDIYLN